MEYSPKKILWILAITVFFVSPSTAQNEWLAVFNYQTLGVNRLGNIPIVNRVTVNSAYDANHQRFFFQGNGTGALPFNLYTIDATTGTVIYQPLSPGTAHVTDQIFGLQYDNAVDTLYALFNASLTGTFYFSWIDPAAGQAHIRGGPTGVFGYSSSAYDTKDHLYFVNGLSSLGPALFVIDSRTGTVLHSSVSPPMSGMYDLCYDNLTGKLYGVYQNAALPDDQFDSIEPSTGIMHTIANLPAYSIPGINAACIDENAGKYIYVGNDPGSSPCHTEHLLVLDIVTGNILSNSVYPYADNAGSTNDENVLDYSFDNTRGILYALNWHEPGTSPFNSATITVPANPICQGTLSVFTARAGQGIVSPSYHWKLNGSDVGTDNPNYSNGNLQNADTIRCVVISNPVCNLPDTVISDSIVMKVVDSTRSSISIRASARTICAGTEAVFTAIPVNGGAAPAYQWQVDGRNSGKDSVGFISSSLQNGDIVTCVLTSSIVCTSPVPSANSIPMTVNPVPAVAFEPDTLVIRNGKSLRLDPVISGAIAGYLWTPAATLDNPSIKSPLATPVNSTIYELTLTASDGCQASGKLTVLLYDSLQMPNAFTPNGDGRNDVFRVPPSLSERISGFYVFDRWGVRVFGANGANGGWDGSFNNQPQATGIYVWEIEYENLLTGKPVMARGTVMLIR
jgi:gliding motility-associated-like protein